MAGVVLLTAGAAAGHSYPAFTLFALVALSAAMSLIVVLPPPSATVCRTARVLLVLLFAGAVGTVNVMGADRRVALGVIIVSAIIVPWALPLAVRRIMRGPRIRRPAPHGRRSDGSSISGAHRGRNS